MTRAGKVNSKILLYAERSEIFVQLAQHNFCTGKLQATNRACRSVGNRITSAWLTNAKLKI